MPSVNDVQQQQQSATTTTMDLTNADPIIQSLSMLEKKQRNLGKRKEKLESYQEEAKKGKELNKDQKDALAKYPEVLGQIDCVKELMEQLKKIQIETTKNQKRLSKLAAEEKRLLTSQRLREYAQIRYLLDHRPTTLKPEESLLLDKLSTLIIPSDNTSNSISRSVDVVLSIYQGGPSTTIIKNLTEKTPQEIRDIIEELIKPSDIQQISSSVLPPPPPSPPASAPEQEQIKELEETNDIQSSNEYSSQFDTREENTSVEQILQNSPFIDLNNQIQDNNRDQSPDPEQFLPTMTVINSSINEQTSSLPIQNQQEENLPDINNTNEEQHSDEQWQHRRGSGNAYRGGQYNNEHGNRGFHRGGSNNYNQHSRRGPRGGGWHDYSYGNNQRQYNENTRGRGGSNSSYRGNRGGNYRGGNRGGYYNTGNGYQQPAQNQQVHSAPPTQQQ